jgi:hypothetical protein
MGPLVPGMKFTPPVSLPEASQATRVADELEGTTSSMLVGREARPSASQRKSSKKEWTWRPRRTLAPSLALWRNASRKEENMPRAPGTANTIERSSPMTCCHFLVEVRRCVLGMPAKMA